MKLPKTFIGYSNIKFVITEFIKMWSNKPSFFSQKRTRAGIAFIVLEIGAIHWLWINNTTVKASEFAIWAAIQVSIISYSIYKIQEEKKDGLDVAKPETDGDAAKV